MKKNENKIKMKIKMDKKQSNESARMHSERKHRNKE